MVGGGMAARGRPCGFLVGWLLGPPARWPFTLFWVGPVVFGLDGHFVCFWVQMKVGWHFVEVGLWFFG